MVRRLPHAVLRGQGVARTDRRRLGVAEAPVRVGFPERLEGRRRALLLRAHLRVSVGVALPQERLQVEGLHGSDDLGPVRHAGQEDEGRRPDADRLRRQGRLAGDGDVRHPQHAAQRLRLPHPPDGGQGSVGQPTGEERLQPVARAPALHLERRSRAHLAGGRPAAAQQASRHVPARLPSSGSSSRSRQTTPTSTSSPSRPSTRSGARTRSMPRSTAS